VATECDRNNTHPGKRPRGEVEMRLTFDLDVRLEGSDIIITHGHKFRAVYYKPAGSPQLILRQRTNATTTNCSPPYG
jgi:hypothetical protein